MPTVRDKELDKLRSLIQVLLFADVVVLVMVVMSRATTVPEVSSEIHDHGESYWSHMEGPVPDGEELGHIDIESEVFLVVCWSSFIISPRCTLPTTPRERKNPPIEWISYSIRGDMILYHWYSFKITHRLLAKLGMPQKGCKYAADGVKNCSTVACCVDGRV